MEKENFFLWQDVPQLSPHCSISIKTISLAMLNTGNADLDVKFFSLSCSHLKNYGSNKCIGDAMLVFLINSILENKSFCTFTSGIWESKNSSPCPGHPYCPFIFISVCILQYTLRCEHHPYFIFICYCQPKLSGFCDDRNKTKPQL